MGDAVRPSKKYTDVTTDCSHRQTQETRARLTERARERELREKVRTVEERCSNIVPLICPLAVCIINVSCVSN